MDLDQLTGPDLILLLLAAPTEGNESPNSIRGITRLEKLLFLIQNECKHNGHIAHDFTFEPYHYGPYSQAIYEDVELLRHAGLLEEQRHLTEYELDRAEELLHSGMTAEVAYERRFSLTEAGIDIASHLAAVNPTLQKEVVALKEQYIAHSLQELISYVYTTYPQFAEQSRIRDQILGPDH